MDHAANARRYRMAVTGTVGDRLAEALGSAVEPRPGGSVLVGDYIDLVVLWVYGFMHLYAARRAGTETGGPLAISALSSLVGFGVMALAPMPIFATFGLLTAVMVVLSLAVSLFVLPSLLVVTGAGAGRRYRLPVTHTAVDNPAAVRTVAGAEQKETIDA